MAKEEAPTQEAGAKKHSRQKSSAMMMLLETRKQASEQYTKAQRAERAYLAKKHATQARQDYDETKTHFREALSHLGQGFRGLVSVVRAVPYLVGEKREAGRRKSDAKKRQRAEEQRKKLEEKLARGGDEGVEEEGEGEEEEEEEEIDDKKKKGKGKDGKK